MNTVLTIRTPFCRALCRVVLWTIILAFPFLGPVIAVKLLPTLGESEATEEVVFESLAVHSSERIRKTPELAQRIYATAEQRVESHRARCRLENSVDGHRLSDSLLAPLRC